MSDEEWGRRGRKGVVVRIRTTGEIMTRGFRAVLPFFSVGLISLTSVIQAGTRHSGKGWSVSFVNESQDSVGSGGLSCRDRILGLVSIPRGVGERNLETIWFRPDGSVEQEASFSIKLAANRVSQAVVWLRLNPGTRGIFGEFTLGDFGGVDHPFDGVWRFEMYNEGHFILGERFNVSCID